MCELLVSLHFAICDLIYDVPSCSHCKSLAPEWKKAAAQLKGIVNIAAIDGDAEKALAGRIGVKGFPTIKVCL